MKNYDGLFTRWLWPWSVKVCIEIPNLVSSVFSLSAQQLSKESNETIHSLPSRLLAWYNASDV